MTDRMTIEQYRQHQALCGVSERQEQQALIQWASYKEGEIPELALLFHVPNGGARTARAGARMKRLGTKAGVPDLCLPVARERPGGGSYGALWIEMKTHSGRLTGPQRRWKEGLTEAGHAHRVCRSWTEARDTILSYLEGTFSP